MRPLEKKVLDAHTVPVIPLSRYPMAIWYLLRCQNLCLDIYMDIINQWKWWQGASNYYVFQKSLKITYYYFVDWSEIKYVFLSYTWTANLLICMLIDCVYIMFCEDAFMITVIRYNKHLKMNKRYQYSFLNYILLMCVVTLHCAILIISREWLMRCKNLHRKKTWRFRPKWSL